MATKPIYTLDFDEIGLKDVARVGGKNASLGQLFNALKPMGVGALDGFATTADAWRRLLIERNLEFQLRSLLSDFDPEDVDELAARGHAARAAVLETPLPDDLRSAILAAYDRLCARRGREALLRATHACFASLFTDRAISYRARHGFDHLQVALSVGAQPMVRSDKAGAGVIFTLDTESGFRDVVVVTGSYGLGEFVVQGVVTPDEWTVFKPTLAKGCRAIIGRRTGSKEVRLVYADGSRATRSEPTPEEERRRLSLSDDEVLKLARWACLVEKHYC